MKNDLVLIILASVILFIGTSEIKAAELSIEYGVYTKHVINYDPLMNEDNDLFTIELKGETHGINISTFNNTYGNDSIAVSGSYKYFSSTYFDASVLYGVVKGYTQEQLKSVCVEDYCLYASPKFTAKFELSDKVTANTSVQLFGTAVVVTIGTSYEF